MRALSQSVLAVQDGRRFVTAQLQQRGVDHHATDMTTLLASELITNALRHGPPPLCLQVVVLADRVRLEVHDSNPAPPVLSRPDAAAEHGRGMWLIDAVSARWGHRPLPPGKVVWLELDRRTM
jgi:anti-sigma regulatory factor (Ser/Thr protein kinase)